MFAITSASFSQRYRDTRCAGQDDLDRLIAGLPKAAQKRGRAASRTSATKSFDSGQVSFEPPESAKQEAPQQAKSASTLYDPSELSETPPAKAAPKAAINYDELAKQAGSVANPPPLPKGYSLAPSPYDEIIQSFGRTSEVPPTASDQREFRILPGTGARRVRAIL